MRKFPAIAALAFLCAIFPRAAWAQDQPAWEVWALHQIIPESPDWLCSIIAKLHAKNPDDRFQSAREVADLLADCEAKLKAKQEVKNVLRAAVKPAASTVSAGWKWVLLGAFTFALLFVVWGQTVILYSINSGRRSFRKNLCFCTDRRAMERPVSPNACCACIAIPS